MKYLITIIACGFLAACGDKDAEETGAEECEAAEESVEEEAEEEAEGETGETGESEEE